MPAPTPDLEDLNAQARQWCDEVANRKIHGTTGQIPFERLEKNSTIYNRW